MKTTLILTAILLIFVSFGCGKEPTEPIDKYPSELIGAWIFTSGTAFTENTTNLDQKIADPFSEGTGSISIGLEGIHLVNLKYMDFEISESSTTFYELVLSKSLSDSSVSASFWASSSQLEDKLYSPFGYNQDFDIDLTTYTVEVQSINLFLFSGERISGSGTLTAPYINFSANNPTTLESHDIEAEYTIDFQEDGTLTSTAELESPGSWRVINDTLRIEQPGSEYDIDIFAYYVFDSRLILIGEESLCENCTDYEGMYGFKSGSIETVVMKDTLNFARPQTVTSTPDVAKWDR